MLMFGYQLSHILHKNSLNTHEWTVTNSVYRVIFNVYMLFFIISSIDDDNRIILGTIPGQQDCQNDYINASFLDVSISNI